MGEFYAKYGIIALFIFDIWLAIKISPDERGAAFWPLVLIIIAEIVVVILIACLRGNSNAPVNEAQNRENYRYYLGLRASKGDDDAWKKLVESYREEFDKENKKCSE